MNIIEKLKGYYKSFIKGSWLYFVIGVTATILLTNFAPEYVDFGNALIRYAFIILTFHLTDKYLLHEWDLIDEIFNKKSMPAAIFVSTYLLGLFILFRAI